MTKNEALKATIEGKKVRVKTWQEDDVVHFMLDRIGMSVRAFMDEKIPEANYEIVPEYVDFATAWKAYEAGKIIKGESGKEYQRNEHEHHWRFSTDDIRGKWIILEDE